MEQEATEVARPTSNDVGEQTATKSSAPADETADETDADETDADETDPEATI